MRYTQHFHRPKRFECISHCYAIATMQRYETDESNERMNGKLKMKQSQNPKFQFDFSNWEECMFELNWMELKAGNGLNSNWWLVVMFAYCKWLAFVFKQKRCTSNKHSFEQKSENGNIYELLIRLLLIWKWCQFFITSIAKCNVIMVFS